MASKTPVFPQHVCPRGGAGTCGFVSAGIGYQCTEGDACQKYVHPGDPGFTELRVYDSAMREKAAPETGKAG